MAPVPSFQGYQLQPQPSAFPAGLSLRANLPQSPESLQMPGITPLYGQMPGAAWDQNLGMAPAGTYGGAASVRSAAVARLLQQLTAQPVGPQTQPPAAQQIPGSSLAQSPVYGAQQMLPCQNMLANQQDTAIVALTSSAKTDFLGTPPATLQAKPEPPEPSQL